MPSLFFCNLDKVADLGELAAGLGIVGLYGLVADLVQTERVGSCDMLVVSAAEALNELYSKISHVSPSLTLDLFRGLASDSRNLSCVAQRLEAFHSGGNDVGGIVGAQALGADVLDAGSLNNGTHSAAGDDAGTFVNGILRSFLRGQEQAGTEAPSQEEAPQEAPAP